LETKNCRETILNFVPDSKALLSCVFFLLTIASSCCEEFPVIGIIDFYGLRTVNLKKVQNQLPIRSGDPVPIDIPKGARVSPEEIRKAFNLAGDGPIPKTQGEIERALEAVPGVSRAKIAVVCCEPNGQRTLFVGIEERGAVPFAYNPAPKEKSFLPEKMVEGYDAFIAAISEGVSKGGLQEDDTEGHALIKGEVFEKLQGQFMAFAKNDAEMLKKVLKGSVDPKHRRAAAWILGYAPDKKMVVDEFLAALRDGDETVRNNATRALGAIAAFAAKHPELGIKIDPDPFIQMLHSLSWSDRNKATMVLLNLTQSRSREILQQLRDRARDPLIEMARWRDSHSLMSFKLLARMAGTKEEEIDKLWESGQREEIIRAAFKESTK
jgi:hypothetical protein